MKKILLLITSIIAFINPVNVVAFTSYYSCDYNSSPFEIGETINSPNDSYTILQELGSGAFGTVYKVENSEQEAFALKAYRHNSSSVSFFSPYEDCDREFSRGQVLDHPHIIKSFEVFPYESASNKQTNNIILQLVEGQTISNTPAGSLSKEEGIQAALQIYDALNYAFMSGYLHLDLHEGNVMLSDQADLMIIDLASFFSFDEIANFVQSTSWSSSYSNFIPIQSLTNRGALALHLNALTQRKKREKGLGKMRKEKLKQFFLNHPALFDQIKQIKQAKKSDNCLVALLADVSHQPTAAANTNELIQSGFFYYYFSLISQMSVEILKKATLPRDEKINIRAEICKVGWNYEEDLSEGKIVPFNQYLDQLSQVLSVL